MSTEKQEQTKKNAISSGEAPSLPATTTLKRMSYKQRMKLPAYRVALDRGAALDRERAPDPFEGLS